MTQPTSSDEPFADRTPTLHERQTGREWDASYREGRPPWDTGRPQPAVVRLAEQGGFRGRVLDAGCGTGANALHLAGLGLGVTGVDVAPTAIKAAVARAAERGLNVTFQVADALQLGQLGQTFDSILDCGLFHTFDDQERLAYVDSLADVTEPGSVLQVLCFSDAEPGDSGPRRVSQDELRASFVDRWRIVSIEPEHFETLLDTARAQAWQATIERV